MATEDLDTMGAVAEFLGNRPDPAQAARAGMSTAIGAKPDTEGQLRGIAKITGLPVDTVRQFPDKIGQKARIQAMDFDALAVQFPKTAAFLGNTDNAKVAHDDIENLGFFETLFNSFQRGPLSFRQGLSSTVIGARAGALKSVDDVEKKLALGQRVLDTEDPYAIQYMTPEQRASFKADLAAGNAKSAQFIANQQAQKAAYPSPEVTAKVNQAQGFVAAMQAFMADPLLFVADVGPESLVQNIPALVGGMAPARLAGKAAVAGAGSFQTDYGSSIMEALGRSGVDLSKPEQIAAAAANPELMQRVLAQAMAHAGVVGAVDAASAGAAGKLLLPSKGALATRPLAREGVNLALQAPAQGVFGAVGEAGGQKAARPNEPLDWGAIIGEFAGEFFGTPGEVASMAVGRVQERLAAAAHAETQAKTFEALNELAAASKVRARDASTFEAFVAAATQDGPVADVYISAQALAQSPVAAQVLAASPSAAKQMDVALETGADIRIPLSEYATTIAGEEFAQPLLEHLKTSPDGYSQAEAKTYIAEHGQALEAEINTLMADRQGDAQFKAQRDAVQATVLDQLTSANRFTADVNAPYASLMANFYAVQAARLGITPQEMFDKYPVKIVAASPAQSAALDQGAHKLSKTQAQELSDREVAGETILNGLSLVDGRLTGPPEQLARLARDLRSDYGGEGFETTGAARKRSMLALADAIEKGAALYQSVSTRVPTAKKATEDAVTQVLDVGLDSSKADPVAFAKNVALVTGYPNYRDAKSATTDEQKAERFIDHVVDNLLWLHDQVSPEIAARSKLWYDGARNITSRWVSKFGYTDSQIAAVLAVQSPQKDWFMNVTLAERILDAMRNRQNVLWSEAMTKTADRIWAKDQYRATRADIEGKTLAELPDDQPGLKAMWIRTFDEAHNTRNYRIVTPEGGFADYATNADGRRSKVAWATVDGIAKAVRILENGSHASISDNLGQQHKVRNFNNNIFDPHDPRGPVTIDTHAVAAALLQPLSGFSTEVTQNFGGAGSASSSINGSQGTYGLYAEAYRRAAAQRGVQAREMQSITWEAVRGLFTAGFKSQAKNTAAVRQVWENYRSKKVTLDEARSQLVALAGGIQEPEWVQSAPGDHEGARDTSYENELPAPGSRQGAEEAAAGVRPARGPVAGLSPLMRSMFDRIAQPDGGFTYSPGLDSEPTTGYAVSIHPEASRAYDAASITFEDLVDYVAEHGDLLGQEGAHIGAWHDPESGKIFLDVTDVVDTPEAAKSLALDHDQIAYFDLAGGSSVTVNPNATSGGAANGQAATAPVEEAGPGVLGEAVSEADRQGADASPSFRSPEEAQALAQSSAAQPHVDRGGLRAQTLADLFVGEPGQPQGDGLVGAPSLLGVLAKVRRAVLDDPQILDAIVESVPVDVVNDLFGSQSAAKVAFHNAPMFKDGSAFDAVLPVSGAGEAADPVLFLLSEAAHAAAKVRGVTLRPGGEAAKGRAATRADQRDSLSQEQRASFSPSTNTIALLSGADLSSFLHESGHFFLQTLAHLASQPNAPAEVQADMQRLLKWFGINTLDEWNAMSLDEQRDSHEKFARGFEAYLFEGNAPSLELRGIFQRFRAWLLNVYKTLASLNVTLNDDVRGVMDRMIATAAQIQDAEAAASMNQVFATPEEAAQFGVDWKSYHDLALEATQNAIGELEAKSLKNMQWLAGAESKHMKALQRANAEKRKAMRAEVRAEAEAQPVYQAQKFLVDNAQQQARGATPEDPDVTAERFGFSSGDEMTKALANAMPIREAIEKRTDQRMLERYGDLNSPEAMAAAVDEAIHNDLRRRFVAAELTALDKAMQAKSGGKPSVNMLPSAARKFVADLLARKRVRDIHPEEYRAAEARASKEAQAALKAGKLDDAAVAKRNQLLNSIANKEAHKTRAEMEKAVAYLRRVGDAKGIDQAYLDQIDMLLEAYDLKTPSLKAADRRTSLAGWVESQREHGIEPDIPQALLDGVDRKPYQNATVEEMRGLVDTIRQIEHIGRLKKRLLTSKAKAEFNAIRDEIVGGIEAHANGRRAETRTINTARAAAARALKGFFSAHIKMGTWARIMDGGRDGGPVWEYLIRAMNDAGNHETVMRAKATADLTALVHPVIKAGKMGGKGLFFESVGMSFNREARLAIALNTGNQGNMQRLLDGQGWTTEQIASILDTLSKEDWDFVQGVWDYFETFRPAIAAKEMRVYGKEPNWIDPHPVETKHGTYRGGYYPIKYDPRASMGAEQHADADEAKRAMQGAYTSATTRRSFTKDRAEKVSGRPLLYSFDGLYNGVQEVIHDLAWHEYLIDANKLLKNPSIDTAIRTTYGPEVIRQFKDGLQDVAAGEMPAMRANERALGWIRQGVSVSGLGLNIMSALVQPLGLTQSIVRIGPKWVAKGVWDTLGSPLETMDRINEQSEFMRTRYLTRLREINEVQNRVSGQTALRRNIDQAAYYMMMRAQQLVDVPTWIGAYEKAISQGNSDERAAALADQAVIDSQGSGSLKDLSSIERGGPAKKLFTTFYSFFNTAFNVGVTQTMTADSIAKRAKLAADYALLFIAPVILGRVMKEALQGGGDLDDPEKLAKKLAGDEISYVMGLMFGVREITGAIQAATGTNEYPTDYSGPAGVRLLADVAKLGKQIGQGEMDDQFRKAFVSVTSELLRLPGAQINRTWTGVQALNEGKTSNPAAVVLGHQEKR